jgi:hypothetical protein
MKSIKDIIALKPVTIEMDGADIVLRRPSALDMVDAIAFLRDQPDRMFAWFVFRHVLVDGAPAFSSIDEVLASDGFVVARIGKEIEKLYGEGRD